MNAVAQVLEARGIAVALDVSEDREFPGRLSGDALMAAAPACTDAADFLRRVREQGALRGRPGRVRRPVTLFLVVAGAGEAPVAPLGGRRWVLQETPDPTWSPNVRSQACRG